MRRGLAPACLLLFFLAYGVAAYLDHEAQFVRGQEQRQRDEVVALGESEVASRATGNTLPPGLRHTSEDDIAALRDRYGIAGNDIPSFAWRGNTVFLCPSSIEQGRCGDGHGAPFGLAYAYQEERSSGGLDTWNVVFAPLGGNRFSRDGVRVLYRINTGGSKVAVLMASSDFGSDALPEPIVGQLNSFDETRMAERIEASANPKDARALNPLGLDPAEMRVRLSPGPPPIPGNAQVAALVDDPTRDFGNWLWADGDRSEIAARLATLSGVLALMASLLAAARWLVRQTSEGMRARRELRELLGDDR